MTLLDNPRRKLRALFINDTSRNGGPGRTLFYILKFLDPTAVHRTVIVPREGVVTELLRAGGVADDIITEPRLIENPFEPWDRAIVRDDFGAAAPIKAARLAGNIARGAAGIASLATFVHNGMFDVIFCNGTTANFAGGALSTMTGVPALWHVFYTHIAAPIRPLHEHLARGKLVRSIVCVSKPSTRLFVNVHHKVKVLHDAIDVAEFDISRIAPSLRAELGLGPDVVIFGSQGRVVPRKGYSEMIRAAKLAHDAMSVPERERTRFIVLGDTPEDMRPNHLEECRALVRVLGLEGWFSLLGYRADVKPLVADFDVGVVPSVYEDPLPRAVLETMALGKAVIAFDVGGIGEMIEHDVSGTLIPGAPADIQALAAQFLRYARDRDLRVRHGSAARARVQQHFDSRKHARDLQHELFRIARPTWN